MRYFENFPKVISTDAQGNSTLATNLLARVNLIPSLINNPALYYKYDMQDGDTPETIASKYYSNPYRYWIFLYGNNIMDPQWDLPLSQKNFEVYLNDKYAAAATAANTSVLQYTQSTVQFYQKIVQTYDSGTQTTTVNSYNISQDVYSNTLSNQVTTRYFPNGDYVQVTQTKQTQSIYDYELQTNENKRRVNVINEKYVDSMEQRLKSLLNA